MSNLNNECVVELKNGVPFCAMKVVSIKRGLTVRQNDDCISFRIVEAKTEDGQPKKYHLLAKASSDCIVNVDYTFVDGDEYFRLLFATITTEENLFAELDYNQIILFVECSEDDYENQDQEVDADDGFQDEDEDEDVKTDGGDSGRESGGGGGGDASQEVNKSNDKSDVNSNTNKTQEIDRFVCLLM
jgi:hypothetical protein